MRLKNTKGHPLSILALAVWITTLLLLVQPALGASTVIDVLPDENVDGSVELTPGFIAGVVDIGGQNISRIDLTASGGDYAAKAYPSAEGPYELTVNVPRGVSLAYTIGGMAWMDNYNTRLYFKDRQAVVETTKTSVVDIIIDAGYITGQIISEGCSIVRGELWAILDTEAGYTRATTKFGSDGSFRFPVQPNKGIRVYGQVQLAGGATVQLEGKYIDVLPAQEHEVTWEVPCLAGQSGAIDHSVDYHFDMDYHYSYLYYQGSGSPYQTVRHDGQILFDPITPGDWRLYTYSYWNSGKNMIAKHLDAIDVPAGEPVPVPIDTAAGFLQGKVTLTGTHTLADTTTAYLYGYGKNTLYPSHNTTSRAAIEGPGGAYNLALPHGEWDIYTSIYYFRNSDPGTAQLQSYLYMYDYKLRQNTTSIEAGQTIGGHDLSYETGAATIKYSRSDGGEFARPHVEARSYLYSDDIYHRLNEYAYVNAHGDPNGDTVTFVGFPGTYEVEAWAYVGQAKTTFGKVAIEIVPGVEKVVDIGGPQLTVTTPAPNTITEAGTVVVSGTATDASGVKDVLVNGEPAFLVSSDNPNDANEVAFSVEIVLEEGENRILTEAVDYSGNTSSDRRAVVRVIPEVTAVSVRVDIKPGSCKNPFNLKSQGVLAVVILGSGDMDATDIDPASITLMGVAPLRAVMDDAASLTPADPKGCETDTPDGYDDLVLKFDTQELVAMLGAVADGDIIDLPLGGTLLDGTELTGGDTITVLKKGNQNTGKKK